MTLRDDLNHEKLMHKVFEQNANEYLLRAEAAEARAAQAEQERDELQAELNTVNMLRTGSEAACDELRRQLTEAQHAIDAMAQIVGAADEVKRQLEQARSDIEDYRAEIERLTRKAATA